MTLGERQEESSYAYRIKHWTHWAEELGYPVLPARPEHLIEYMQMKDDSGIVAATIAADVQAISRLHRERGEDDPLNEEIRNLLSNMMKGYAPSRIVETITAQRLESIRATACLPRGSEKPEKARLRGQVDIALIATMRDGMLRSAHAREMRYGDITESEDGSGVLRIHDNRWQDAYLSAATMAALSAIRQGRENDAKVFDMPRESIYVRIRKAARYAGLGSTGYNSDSPRLGMAEDLINADFGLPAIMAAGRWSNPNTLLRRFKKEIARRGAIAKLHGTMENG